jgi:hypothetical protein
MSDPIWSLSSIELGMTLALFSITSMRPCFR